MGNYDFKDSDTVELVDSGVILTTGDVIDTVTRDDRRKEVIDLQKDGYVKFRFIGDDFDEIVQGDVGSDLLSVWDISFTNNEYERQ